MRPIRWTTAALAPNFDSSEYVDSSPKATGYQIASVLIQVSRMTNKTIAAREPTMPRRTRAESLSEVPSPAGVRANAGARARLTTKREATLSSFERKGLGCSARTESRAPDARFVRALRSKH